MENKIYHITSTITTNQANSIMINFHSSVKDSIVLITEEDDVSFKKAIQYPVEGLFWSTEEIANHTPHSTFTIGRYVCHVLIDGLKPNTKYLYKITNSEFTSKVNSFKTATFENEWSFFGFADMQYSNNQTSIKLINLMKEMHPDTHLFVSSGDLTDYADREDAYFNLTNNHVFDGMTLVLAPGDHEYWGDDTNGYKQLKYPYCFTNLFHFPHNGAVSSLGTNYYFIYQNVLFAVFDMNDSNTSKGDRINEQAKWFDELLTNIDKSFSYIVAVEHKSLFSSTIEDSAVALNLRPVFAPLFKKHHVDLVISGHDHMYSRTSNLDGTYYLDLGSSGDKRRHLDDSLINSKIHEKVIDLKKLGDSLACLVKVSAKNLEITVYNLKHQIVDSFIIEQKAR